MCLDISIVYIHILQIIENTFLQTQNNAAWCRLHSILHPFHPIFSITAISDHIWPLQELDLQCSSYFEVCEIDINFHAPEPVGRYPTCIRNNYMTRQCSKYLKMVLVIAAFIGSLPMNLSNPKETLQTLICGEAVLLQDSKGNITYTFPLLQSRTNQIN